MLRHLICDAHEWINEIPGAPIYCLTENHGQGNGLGIIKGRALLSLTLARLHEMTQGMCVFVWLCVWRWRGGGGGVCVCVWCVCVVSTSLLKNYGEQISEEMRDQISRKHVQSYFKLWC